MPGIACLIRPRHDTSMIAVKTGGRVLPLTPTTLPLELDGYRCSLTIEKRRCNKNVWLHAALRCNGETVDACMRARLEHNPHLCLDLDNARFCVEDRGTCTPGQPGPNVDDYIRGSRSLASGLLLAAALCTGASRLEERCLTPAAPLLVAELAGNHGGGLLEAACREAHRADPHGATLSERLLQALHGAGCKPQGLRLLWAAAHIEERLGLGDSIRRLYEEILLEGRHEHNAELHGLLQGLVEAAWLGDINEHDAYEIIGIATRNKNSECKLERGPPPRLTCNRATYMLSTAR